MGNTDLLITLHEENISNKYLEDLKKTFLEHPGQDKVILKIIYGGATSYKLIELQKIKVNTNISLLLGLIHLI